MGSPNKIFCKERNVNQGRTGRNFLTGQLVFLGAQHRNEANEIEVGVTSKGTIEKGQYFCFTQMDKASIHKCYFLIEKILKLKIELSFLKMCKYLHKTCIYHCTLK